MSTVLEFKCPCCGGKLEFDASTQKMKCPYCDSEIDVDALNKNEQILEEVGKEDNMNWESTAGTEWDDGEQDTINVYSCTACGGEIVADETTGATHCPYCGNPVVMTSKFSGQFKPDCVIPFSITKQQAVDALKKHYEGKKLLPKIFKSENHLDEIKGVYVPFWLFDADANASVSYKMENVRSWSDKDYMYTQTEYFTALRKGGLKFKNVPVDGASKMPDELMESIEPFDASKAVDFKTAYLSGFMADKYDIDDRASVPRANERIKKSTEEAFRDTVHGYSSVQVNDSHVSLSASKAKYALYPVWLLTTSFGGKQYLFAVNGQTGKLVGNLPVDKGLQWKYRLLYTLAFGAASYILLWLIMNFGGGIL
ncbi:MAG: hypothetical protein MJ177_04430 [Clostridia bacterium]|nr:hypothetical protein [Clostridia bacterium]